MKCSLRSAATVGVLEGFVGHDVTPVTRGVADREEDGTVESRGLVQRRLVPRPPVDGVVGVLAQVGTGRARETIGHWSSVGVAVRRLATSRGVRRFRFSVRVEEHRDRDAAGRADELTGDVDEQRAGRDTRETLGEGARHRDRGIGERRR